MSGITNSFKKSTLIYIIVGIVLVTFLILAGVWGYSIIQKSQTESQQLITNSTTELNESTDSQNNSTSNSAQSELANEQSKNNTLMNLMPRDKNMIVSINNQPLVGAYGGVDQICGVEGVVTYQEKSGDGIMKVVSKDLMKTAEQKLAFEKVVKFIETNEGYNLDASSENPLDVISSTACSSGYNYKIYDLPEVVFLDADKSRALLSAQGNGGIPSPVIIIAAKRGDNILLITQPFTQEIPNNCESESNPKECIINTTSTDQSKTKVQNAAQRLARKFMLN